MYFEDYAREVVTEDYLYDKWNHNTTNAPGGNHYDPCGATHIQLGDWRINSPSLIPTCLLAAAVGIFCGLRIKRSNGQSSSAYSTSFFMFACMMTDAMIFHCFLHDSNSSISAIVSGIIDVGLTSSIGLSFGFNALFDMGLMQAGRKSTLIMVGTYALMIGAWVYAMVHQVHQAFMILYLGVVAVSCGLYSVITLIRVIKSGGLGLKWLLIGVGYGALGLAAVFYSPLARLLCAVFTRWFNSEFWWFFLSDVSMYYLYKYYMASHVPAKTSAVVNYDSDSELEEDDEESDEEVQRFIKPRAATTFVQQEQNQQQIVYIPMPYYNTTPTNAYYVPQTAPVYYY